MKYLQDYKNEKQTALFNECCAFFAFSQEQLLEGMKKFDLGEVDGKYDIYSMGAGMYVKKEHAKKLVEGLDEIEQEAMAQDIADHGLKRIILRELDNHEYVITGDIHDTWEAIKNYPGIKKEYVQRLAGNRGYKIPIDENI